jgi:hypothetical protein
MLFGGRRISAVAFQFQWVAMNCRDASLRSHDSRRVFHSFLTPFPPLSPDTFLPLLPCETILQLFPELHQTGLEM